MKRILFVCVSDPFGKGGGSQATLAFLQAVFDIYGREIVDVMMSEECIVSNQYQDVHYIRIPKRSFFRRLIEFPLGYLTRMAMPLQKYLHDNYQKYHICIINTGESHRCIVKYLNRKGVKSCVIHHNYEIEYNMDNKTPQSFYGLFPYYIKMAEKTCYKYSDINLFLTNQDCQKFKKVYGNTIAKNFVIGTFETKDSMQGILSLDKKFCFSISGSLCDFQTLCGLKDFIDNYLPIAKELIPNLNIVLTGRKPLKEIYDIAMDNKEFVIEPNPEHIFSIVTKGQVYLCPTNIGGGLKLRAMDGLKCGLPILVHKVSSRGYDYFFDKPYFKIYEDATSFKKGLLEIMDFLKNNTDSVKIINNDFYSYFGYYEGVERMRNALNEVSIR